MKKQQKLQDAIGLVGEDLILEAKAQKRKAIRFLRYWYIPSVAAVVIVAIVVGAFVWKGRLPNEEDIAGSTIGGNDLTEDPPPNEGSIGEPTEPAAPDDNTSKPQENNTSKPGSSSGLKVQQLAAAVYPETPYRLPYRKQMAEEAGDLDDFTAKTMETFLSGTENQIYSPLTFYISLGMLAELTEGDSQKELLALLGAEQVEDVRQKAVKLLDSNYDDQKYFTSRQANSIWLRDNVQADQETLDLLGEYYYASTYRGDPSHLLFQQAMKEWLNEQTKGMMEDDIKNISTNRNTVFSLFSTVLFRAEWLELFRKELTKEGVFHAKKGDVTCDFMYQSSANNYYYGEQFTAIYKDFGYPAGRMWLILPNEGVEASALSSDPQVHQLINGEYKENVKRRIVNLSLPKFDISTECDLTNGLKKLGISTLFDGETADFSAVQKEGGVCLTEATQALRVAMDERGCTAAGAYQYEGTDEFDPTEEIVDFTLDRPFLFAVTSEHNVPLFIGTVQNP